MTSSLAIALPATVAVLEHQQRQSLEDIKGHVAKITAMESQLQELQADHGHLKNQLEETIAKESTALEAVAKAEEQIQHAENGRTVAVLSQEGLKKEVDGLQK